MLRAASANEEIRIAILGAGWRGGQLIPQFGRIPGVRIVTVCDPDLSRATDLAQRVEQASGGRKTLAEQDLRRVIDDQNVDAVVISTPNHWHALATVWACEAGKHVYVEKPVAHSLWESRRMLEAATRHKRIVQGGTHRRSFANLQRIMTRIQAGEFGKTVRGRLVTYKDRASIGKRSTPMALPPEIDYDLWAGPAPTSPIYRDEFHYDWHWVWETGNGELANNGSHMLDLVRWALGQPKLAPAVMMFGGRFVWDDAGETPNTVVAYFDYAPAPIIAEIRNVPAAPGPNGEAGEQRHGFVIECEHATISGGNHYEVIDRDGKVVESESMKEENYHPANFIDALRKGTPDALSCPLEEAHPSCGLALQANVSYHLGSAGVGALDEVLKDTDAGLRPTVERMLAHLDALGVDARTKVTTGPMLSFDPETERFTGPRAKAANQHLKRESYRAPFTL
jgi:predicted dehydrogenase